ncbi:hypothetical protein QJS66_01415 [Kocuria rhizophila]|nr:hypothetical protein QJS66_01415 [Kocuria rhizophila]
MEYSKALPGADLPGPPSHFRSLPEAERDRLNASQPQLHRGISEKTIEAVHEALYVRRGRSPSRARAAGRPPSSRARGTRAATVLQWRNTENHRVLA